MKTRKTDCQHEPNWPLCFHPENHKPQHTSALMQLPEKSVNVPYLRAQLGQLHDHELDYIVRAVNAHEDLLEAAKNARNVLAALAVGDLKQVRVDSSALLALRSAIAKAEGGIQ